MTAAAMTSSPDLVSPGLVSLGLVTLDPGLAPAGEAGGRTRGAGATSPSWPLRPGSGAAVWRLVCAAGAAGTRSHCYHCPARYATAAETEPTNIERRMTRRKEERKTDGKKERQERPEEGRQETSLKNAALFETKQ